LSAESFFDTGKSDAVGCSDDIREKQVAMFENRSNAAAGPLHQLLAAG